MAKLLPVAYVMAGVILVMSVVLIYADIVAPVRLGYDRPSLGSPGISRSR